jgi:hypothetical protein
MEDILLAGDWHGFTPHATWVLERAKALGIRRVFQLGDFGLWEHEHSGIEYLDDLDELTDQHDVDIYCLAGNHDNERLAVQLHAASLDADGFVVLRPRVKLALRGHRWTWEGTRFLALGGAYSVDKLYRTNREDEKTRRSRRESVQYGKPFRDFAGTLWFPDEELTHQNVLTAIGDGSHVDVMLTHDKPLRSTPSWNRKDLIECRPNQEKIQEVVNATRPRLLVHGHLHFPYDCAMRDNRGNFTTHVVGLDADAEAQKFERGYDPKNSIAVLTLDRGLKSLTVNGDRTINT